MAKFLDRDQEETLVSAIQEAEKQTSGEIRLHIEKTCSEEDPLNRAQEVFASLEMHETEQNNGILIYVSWKDHKIAIWGGQGIHEKVGQDFWNDELNLLIEYFKKEEYVEGLRTVILQIGDKLKEFYPYQSDDRNELSDDISYE